MKKTISSLALTVMLASNTATAGFYIDMQGLNKAQKTIPGVADGYKMLTGKYYGIIHEVGKGNPSKTHSFGDSSTIADAMFMIMPDGWYAFVDETVEEIPLVSWDASHDKGQYWTDVLADIGKDYGLRYVIDWDQKLVQIDLEPDFTKPDYDDPIVVADSNDERQMFIYKKKPNLSGYLLRDGEYIPVKVSN
ncbi:hypothetical protein [Salinimonas iocasae]|uniref:Uncharacterized protein n=1 Tax=Salinimonas iocasae TaxID=2572577 RepID=A0A5B7YJ33_9ALTE|nr:hypothetical protein [Salinimonas iocasae]QCZ95528.1 hypothetical protein FBQ74_18580 [Salinimonas iocasae]